MVKEDMQLVGATEEDAEDGMMETSDRLQQPLKGKAEKKKSVALYIVYKLPVYIK